MSQLPPVVYATFVGPITQEIIGRVIFHLNGATQGGVVEAHIMFQSIGGIVGDGLALFSYFDASPLQIHLYNGGAVESVAVVSYLGAKHRYASAHGSFMLHRSHAAPPSMGAEAYAVRAQSLAMDDARVAAIVKARTTVDPQRYERADLTLAAQEAVDLGIAHSIRDFKVPAGQKLYDLTQRQP